MTIEAGRRDDWMQTYSGRAFYPVDPHPDDVDPADIAHALSMICRFGGHCRRFFSVAEHCVLMSQAVSPEHALEALLHDAAEAYVNDLVRPLKYALPDYRALEDRVDAAIRTRFMLTGARPAEVKEADLRILRDERDALMGDPPLPWTSIEQSPRLGVNIQCWPPQIAEQMYLMRLAELMETGPHPLANCGPLSIGLPRGQVCPTCGVPAGRKPTQKQLAAARKRWPTYPRGLWTNFT